MSNGYRAQWKTDSAREAEVEHFKKLRVAENFLMRVVEEATAYMDEQDAAIKAGVPPIVAQFGSRATGLDATGEPLPKKEPEEPKKPRKGQPYRARVYAPQMVALGARAALLLIDFAPVVKAHWVRLVEAGIDPRRLALDDDQAKIAALLFDEIGVQYHEVDAGNAQRIAEALDKLEAWVRRMAEEERKRGAASAAPSEASAAEPAKADAPPSSTLESESAGKPAHSKESASEAPQNGREAAPYSASGNSLDWTKL